jgi:hypothetical protein
MRIDFLPRKIAPRPAPVDPRSNRSRANEYARKCQMEQKLERDAAFVKRKLAEASA